MAHLLVQFNVGDYDTWRSVFEDYRPIREDYGCLDENVFQSADNPNAITLILEWDNFDNAQAFVQSDDLREAMRSAGVQGPPSITFLNEV